MDCSGRYDDVKGTHSLTRSTSGGDGDDISRASAGYAINKKDSEVHSKESHLANLRARKKKSQVSLDLKNPVVAGNSEHG